MNHHLNLTGQSKEKLPGCCKQAVTDLAKL